jgi:D-3-phosphoglycerate dehydrogenase
LKKIVLSGQRFFMKWQDLTYFERRAEEANARIVPVYSEDENEFSSSVRDASAIVVIARNISRETIEKLDRCEIILALSVGYDCIAVDAATEKSIVVSNAPVYCTDDVANHAMTLILTVSRKVPTLIEETRLAKWDYNVAKPVFNFRGKTLGIIGFGKIGRTLAGKANGFGMEVTAYDPYVDDDIFELLGVKRRYELFELLEGADYISVHARLTPETHHMLDKDAFSHMKETAVLVNTARGNIIDEDALYTALETGGIAGAGVDVLSEEPPQKENRLLKCDNLVITPHIAWYSEESLARVKVQGMDEVVGVLSGKRPRYIVNPEIFGRLNTR